jgi:hypothetical protein
MSAAVESCKTQSFATRKHNFFHEQIYFILYTQRIVSDPPIGSCFFQTSHPSTVDFCKYKKVNSVPYPFTFILHLLMSRYNLSYMLQWRNLLI